SRPPRDVRTQATARRMPSSQQNRNLRRKSRQQNTRKWLKLIRIKRRRRASWSVPILRKKKQVLSQAPTQSIHSTVKKCRSGFPITFLHHTEQVQSWRFLHTISVTISSRRNSTCRSLK